MFTRIEDYSVLGFDEVQFRRCFVGIRCFRVHIGTSNRMWKICTDVEQGMISSFKAWFVSFIPGRHNRP
jgi:hypothetical protein